MVTNARPWERLQMKRRAKILQRYFTPSERRLWEGLGDGRLLGFEFVHQRPIGLQVVDFYCPEAQLAIDILRDWQRGEERLERKRRYLAKRNVDWLVFTEDEVQWYWHDTLRQVRRQLQQAVRRANGTQPA